MLLTLLCVQLSLAAAPSSTVVVVTRRTAVTSAEAQSLATLVTRTLKDVGVQVGDVDAAARRLASLGVKDTSVCAGRKSCIQEFGRQLDVSAVVGLSVSDLDKDRSVSLELVRVSDGEVLETENVLYPSREAPPEEILTGFARRALIALPAPVADAPLKPMVLELIAEPAPVLVAAPVDSHTGRWVTTGGAVVALGAAVVLGAVAFSTRGELSRGTTLPDGRAASALTGAQAEATSARANGEFLGAVICAALGVGLGTTAVVLW